MAQRPRRRRRRGGGNAPSMGSELTGTFNDIVALDDGPTGVGIADLPRNTGAEPLYMDEEASEGEGYSDRGYENGGAGGDAILDNAIGAPSQALTEPLDDVEFQSRVWKNVTEAENFVDIIIGPQRLEAAKFYDAKPFGDELEGRSQIVMTTVADAVQQMLPSLLRIFCGSDKVGEYIPRSARAVPGADQATEAVNYIFLEQNRGFTLLYSWFKDALIKKLGVMTWYPEEHENVIVRQFSGLTEMQIAAFQQANPNASFKSITPMPDSPGFFKCAVELRDKNRRYHVRCVPPEEFLIDRRATSIERADLVGTRTMRTVSELVEMGFDEEEIREHGSPGRDDGWYWMFERIERNPGFQWPEYPIDKSMERVKFYDIYVRVDKDGDGVAELHRVRAIGEACYVLKDEVVDEAPFAVICPDPEPHTVYGKSVAERVMDLQKIESYMMRGVLDSLAQSINPRLGVVEGQVNLDDVLNNENGSVIRVRAPGMIQELNTTFVGQAAMPILDYLEGVKAKRIGPPPQGAALDADVLQSTTKAAVNAQINASQERIEMIARIFAETGFVSLFKGLLKMICENQDQPMMLKLRGQFVEVDPTTWDVGMDVSINVGLGRGDEQTQIGTLMQIAEKQEQILQTLGPNNPLVSLKQYRDTLAEITSKSGKKDPARYWKEITPEVEQQMAMAMSNQPPTPDEILARAQLAKVKAEAFAKAQEEAINRAKLQLDADAQRDKLDADVILRAADLMGKYGQPIDVSSILAMVNRPRPDIQMIADALIQRERAAQGMIFEDIERTAQTQPKPLGSPQQGDGPSDPSGQNNAQKQLEQMKVGNG